MKIQMVCLANSKVEGGRMVVGILVQDDLPVVDADGPRWLRLSIDPKRKSIPTGLVVDILPRDVLEFETIAVTSLDQCRGEVLVDPYTIKFVGRMPEERIFPRCALLSEALPSGIANKPLKRDGWALVSARCGAVEHEENWGRRQMDGIRLTFEYRGESFRFPIRDPWFFDAVQVNPDLLAGRTTHYLLIRHGHTSRLAEASPWIMSIML